MTYNHLHLDFCEGTSFMSDGAFSTEETVVHKTLLPIAPHRNAGEKAAFAAYKKLRGLIEDILSKVEVKWLDQMNQKPTVIYQADVEQLISKLMLEFYEISYIEELELSDKSDNWKEEASNEFYGNLQRKIEEKYFEFTIPDNGYHCRA